LVEFKDLRYADLMPGEIYKAGSTGNFFANEVISNLFKFDNLRGIGNQSGIRRSMIEKTSTLENEEAFTVLLDTKSDAQWPNEYNKLTNILKYYGDNQDPKKHYLDTKQRGNVALQKYFHRAYGDTRDYMAPFFYFERVSGQDARFIGIAVPYVNGRSLGDVLQLKQFTKPNEGKYENYVAEFTVLEVPVPRQWLYDLKNGISMSEYIPTAWYNYLQTRKITEQDPKDAISFNHPDNNLPTNTGYRFTSYRKTQSKFRTQLLNRESGCQLCNITTQSLLVASHIIPWAVSDETQKTDTNNGLLLCILHDALFDKGYISIEENGQILISDQLSSPELERLNINPKMSINVLPEQEEYLKIHRAYLKQTITN
jgi:Restriction endonuclease AspBHI N-terminal/HNH endonuclease